MHGPPELHHDQSNVFVFGWPRLASSLACHCFEGLSLSWHGPPSMAEQIALQHGMCDWIRPSTIEVHHAIAVVDQRTQMWLNCDNPVMQRRCSVQLAVRMACMMMPTLHTSRLPAQTATAASFSFVWTMPSIANTHMRCFT